MTLDQRQIIVSTSTASGGIQDVETTGIGVDASNHITGPNYKIAPDAGVEGQVLTLDAAGTTAIMKSIPRANSYAYRASTNITPPPSNGQVRWNNATQNIATLVHLSGTNQEGNDIIALLKATVLPGNKLLFSNASDQGNFQEFNIESVVDNTTYLSVTVTIADSAGGNFSNNSNIFTTVVTGVTAQTLQETSVRTITDQNISRNIYEVDTSGGEFNLTLPAVATVRGQRYTFIKTTNDTNRVLVFPNGSETINGFPRWQLNAQFDSVTFIPNGTDWYVIILTPHIKTLSVIKDDTVQAIATGTPTVVKWQTVVGVSPLSSFDNVTDNDWDSKNGGFYFDISVKILQLDANEFVKVCLRFDGVIVACETKRATFNNQDTPVRLQGQSSTFGALDTVLTGNWDVTIEHDHGSDLDMDTTPLETYWKMRRAQF